jgi:hypothetical protein
MQIDHPSDQDGGNAMQFGYFTLSDNRYPNNPRQAEDFIKDIYAEALYAEKVGLNSAWIGERHWRSWRSSPALRPSFAWRPP